MLRATQTVNCVLVRPLTSPRVAGPRRAVLGCGAALPRLRVAALAGVRTETASIIVLGTTKAVISVDGSNDFEKRFSV